jgi:peptidyl-tRNA hydrolase, PTH1 family
MILIIGLGNPGEKYQNTPHNIGFETVEKFARKNNFPEFSLSKKIHSFVSKKEGVVLVKPRTFMNRSGQAVKEAASFWKAAEEKIIIIHDDIDLPFGKIKIAKNRGSAGHKGIESIIQHMGNKRFTRIRIGVSPEKKVSNPEKFVIKKFSQKDVESVIEKSVNALEDILKNGIEKAMSVYN